MSNILVINSGSTSIKYKVFNKQEKELSGGNLKNFENHESAFREILRNIVNIWEIAAVGHRVVHGGDKFYEPVVVNDNILSELEQLNDLALLHNPYNLAGIKAARDYMPGVPQVAVFDTAFYFNLPEIARTYAIPLEIARKYNIKRYGFHGISCEFVVNEAAKQLKKDLRKINLIVCHLGGGWSISAIKKGKPIDTSMGFTPMDGLVMMTRSGDIDPGIIFKLLKTEEKFCCETVYNLLNRESGIKGVSGGIEDFRVLLKEMNFGNAKAKLAFDVAVYRLIKYVGAYWTLLEGKVDAVVFTGGIGSGDAITRDTVMGKLKFLNVKSLAIKTNEELMIAEKVRQIFAVF